MASNCYKMSVELKNHAAVQAVAGGNSELSAVLHAPVQTENPGNLIYSAFSLSAVVAMAYLGAGGSTASEIRSVFGFPEDQLLTDGYSKVLAALQEITDGHTFAAANRLYSQTGFALKKEFCNRIQKTFGAEVQQLDFAKNVAAAAEINKWVKKITKRKIKNLILPETLNDSTRIILVNAVYFKGLWKDKFDEYQTEKEKFHVNEKETVEVDMMFQEADVLYARLDNLNAHAVALPYKGDRLSMLIYAPLEINGFSKIEQALKTLVPSQILDKFESETVEVSLPRFKIESTMSLIEPLKALGVKSMFGAADFNGITEAGLYVSGIVQKAFIEVNEEGTEAAAATEWRKHAKCLKISPMSTEFKADRPFYIQIVDRHTNFVLFAGTVKNPTA